MIAARTKRARFARALLVGALAWGGPWPPALAAADPTQTLVINYPNAGIALGGPGSPVYRGLIYVKVYPVGPELVKRYGGKPIASAELSASGRDVRELPLGEYEVQFALRVGGELKTFILRDVILRADRASALTVEMNGDAKTTVVGGDMTAQHMAATIKQLQAQVAELQRQLAALQKK